MIAIGNRPDFSSIQKVEPLAIQHSQKFLQKQVSIMVPNVPLSSIWFIHDGETGTSHNFIENSAEQIQMERIEPHLTILAKVIEACATAGSSFRIWWAGGEFELEICLSIDEVIDTIAKQAKSGEDISIEYTLI